MSQGKSIKLFLADGTPGGIITAEIINWTGHVISAPRSRLAELLARPEAARPGLYVLVGEALDGSGPQAYIGETENLGERLKAHAKPESPDGKGGKDFWDKAYVISSKDANLTKGHLRFVESRLISQALAAHRIPLENQKGTQSEYGVLPEADQADMLYFIEQIKLVLPVLGLDLLRETNALAAGQPQQAVPRFELHAPKLGIAAQALEQDDEFVVLRGSLARSTWSLQQEGSGYQKLHQQLQRQGVLVAADAELLQFSCDYAFSSPSAASAVVLGRSDNGRKSWLLAGSKQTYGDWQTAQLTKPDQLQS